MEKIKDNTQRARPRRSCFMGCFGFSEKVPEKKKPVNPSHRERIKQFSWTLSRKKKSDVKTVPMDAPIPEKANRSRPIISVKKATSKLHFPARGKIPEGVPHEVVNEKYDKAKSESEQKIILEVPNHQNDLAPQESNTCQSGLSPSRNLAAPKAAAERDSSPERMLKAGGAGILLSHSSSFPVTADKKKAADIGRTQQKLPATTRESQRRGATAKTDPVVGLSIIVVTLIIMLIWGRFCAILCTSAWLYFVHQFAPTSSFSNVNSELLCGPGEVEDKKKVVMEGFLERKRHLRKAKSSL